MDQLRDELRTMFQEFSQQFLATQRPQSPVDVPGRSTSRDTTEPAPDIPWEDLLIDIPVSQVLLSDSDSKIYRLAKEVKRRARPTRYQHSSPPSGTLARLSSTYAELRSARPPVAARHHHQRMARGSLLLPAGHRRISRRRSRLLDLLSAAAGQSGPARPRSRSRPVFHTPPSSEDQVIDQRSGVLLHQSHVADQLPPTRPVTPSVYKALRLR
jgi:hypothetical protein